MHTHRLARPDLAESLIVLENSLFPQVSKPPLALSSHILAADKVEQEPWKSVIPSYYNNIQTLNLLYKAVNARDTCLFYCVLLSKEDYLCRLVHFLNPKWTLLFYRSFFSYCRCWWLCGGRFILRSNRYLIGDPKRSSQMQTSLVGWKITLSTNPAVCRTNLRQSTMEVLTVVDIWP